MRFFLRIGGFFKSLLLGIAGLFVSLFRLIIRFLRQVVRLSILPFSRFLKGTRLWKWANADEPENEEERFFLKKYRINRFITWILLAAIASLCILIFGNPFRRAESSFNYIGQAFRFIFGTWADPETATQPEISNGMKEQFDSIFANISNFWFYIQAWVGALFNPDIAKEWGHDIMEFGANIMRFVSWIPTIVIFVRQIKSKVTAPHPDEEIGPTPALRKWDEVIVPKYIRPIQRTVASYFKFLGTYRWIKFSLLAIIGSCCIVGWAVLDTLTSYILMVLTFDFGWMPTYLASLFVDAVVFFARIGIPGTLLVVSVIYVKSVKAIAVGRLAEMQRMNEEFANSLPNISAITGPVGSGKTTMQSSVAIDIEAITRDKCLGMMKKYAAAFPKFDWRKLEKWVVLASSEDDDDDLPEGEPMKARAFILKTRAQVRIALKFLWKDYVKSDFSLTLENGHEAFFGYDAARGLLWNDGAKDVSLLEAVQTYAECYFLYYSGQKLATSNYPIAFPGKRQGDHFPVYDPSNAYIFESGPSEIGGFSHVMDMDFFRITNPVDGKSDSRKASIDGGVVSMTEGSNERGNRFDYVGQKKTDGEANPLNDGWNKAMRLIRHWFTIDGNPMVKFIYDYQRGDSMNAETRDSAEDMITIMQRMEEDNVLPFWDIDDFICSTVETWWTNYYYYTWKPNRGKDTLFNAFLKWLCNKFINHKQRMRYRYGYETIIFNREHGGMNGLTGKRTTEQYYSIFRRTRGELFNTAVYGPILEQPALTANSGWMDQPVYTSVDATSEEFKIQHSYFIKGISGLFDPKETTRAVKRIRDAQDSGSDTPFIGREEK